MSGNAARGRDRRVRRTREALGDALVELIREKPFARITVQDVLDRAGVGRSTFYTHFSGKDDLFLSDVEDFFEHMSSLPARRGERSHRVAPVRELLAHVAEVGDFHAALVRSGRVHDVLEMGREYFARAIEERLARLSARPGPRSPSPGAAGQALSGALFALLTWWIERGMPATPEEIDGFFHRLVWSGVGRPKEGA